MAHHLLALATIPLWLLLGEGIARCIRAVTDRAILLLALVFSAIIRLVAWALRAAGFLQPASKPL